MRFTVSIHAPVIPDRGHRQSFIARGIAPTGKRQDERTMTTMTTSHDVAYGIERVGCAPFEPMATKLLLDRMSCVHCRNCAVKDKVIEWRRLISMKS
jgi:hypothetical protein